MALTQALGARIVAFDTCDSDVFYRFPTPTTLPVLMYNSEPALHRSCYRSSKQDGSVFQARCMDGWLTWPVHRTTEGAAQDVHITPDWTLDVDLQLLNHWLNSAWRLVQDG